MTLLPVFANLAKLVELDKQNIIFQISMYTAELDYYKVQSEST